ncbi:hypothetical protein NDN08_002070 [Rhodosorus marinus]|uniref:Uncharacterized protein n=1 Tax=Rhodosorus marinus TaxID=101924 RepID=A0AAV8UVI5_9RHOD|nr:hypothetical protein NDN08_002070 [Rhodosorus marinus]
MRTSALAFAVVAAIVVVAQASDIHGHHDKFYETCATFTDMYKDVFLEGNKNEVCYFLVTKRGFPVAKVCASMKNIFDRIDYKNPFKGKENCISFTFHAKPGFLLSGVAAGVSNSFKSAAKNPFQKLRAVMAVPKPGKDDCKYVGGAVSCRVPLFCKYKIEHDHHDDKGKDHGKGKNGRD